MKINFVEVGRDKVSFQAEVPIVRGELDYAMMCKLARKHGRLMSSDVDVSCDPDSLTGAIIVGGFRMVGSWSASQ